MKRERAGVTLQPTALANEVYLRLVRTREVAWNDRVHFFAVAAQMMRRMLVDAARARVSAKRGGHVRWAEHSSAFDPDGIPGTLHVRDRELVAVDEALEALAAVDRRKAQVVELRFFGGLSVAETAAALGVSPETVLRDWKLAKACLRRHMSQSME
jgi:RNA polymerase sigma factor (TIGR02999 family)